MSGKFLPSFQAPLGCGILFVAGAGFLTGYSGDPFPPHKQAVVAVIGMIIGFSYFWRHRDSGSDRNGGDPLGAPGEGESHG